MGEPFLLLDAYTPQPQPNTTPRIAPLGDDGFAVVVGNLGDFVKKVSSAGEVELLASLPPYGASQRVVATVNGGAMVVWVQGTAGDFEIHGFTIAANGALGSEFALPTPLGVYPFSLFDAAFDGSVVQIAWAMEGIPSSSKSRFGTATITPDGTPGSFVVRDLPTPIFNGDHLVCGAGRCILSSTPYGPLFAWSGTEEPQEVTLAAAYPEPLGLTHSYFQYRDGQFRAVGGLVDPACTKEWFWCLRGASDFSFDLDAATFTEEPLFDLDTLGPEDENFGFAVASNGGRLVGWSRLSPTERDARLRSHADAPSVATPGSITVIGASRAGRFLAVIHRDDSPGRPPEGQLWGLLVDLAPL